MKTVLLFGWLLLVTTIIYAVSPRMINGTVTDDAGNPLITQIVLKETGKIFQSGPDGKFRITISTAQAILVFTSVGFETKEVVLGKENTLTVRLRPAVTVLSEVVVTGYGTQQKKDMTGYIAGISRPGNLGTPSSPMLGGQVRGLAKTGIYMEEQLHDRFYKQKSFDREGYDAITENSFLTVANNPLSTFSIDVDAASYSNVRRILKSGQLPQRDAVRIEEMVNYFKYEYAQPTGKMPFAVHTEWAVCPWNRQHQLVLIGLQGKKMDVTELPPSNLTFLVDVSGSMMTYDKLPLVQASLKLLTDQLRPQDKVAIVAYAGNAGLVLPATSGESKIQIKESIDRLVAGGSTAGGAGIQLAYKIARENFQKEGNNRVILCTDGDFNVGTSSDAALEQLIEQERKTGVYLTVLGYGTGNYQDAKMQKLADKGNGNHAYIDGIGEAKKVLINEFGGTLFTIAKDVKLQIEFNPEQVKGYRLIGYENRMLAKEDFNDDQKDAGELGSGHTVTALYEVIPNGVEMPNVSGVDSLRYQVKLNAKVTQQKNYSGELMNIKLRYKEPDSDKSLLISTPVKGKPVLIENGSENFRFAAAVASFGMLLRNSDYKGEASYQSVKSMAMKAMGKDAEGYRKEFIELVNMAARISGKGEMAVNVDEDLY
ncbi:MAG: von Willebrand factor type A domain-containing protein [Bacteroidota bacterium]